MFTTTRPAQKRGSRFRPPNPHCTAHAQSQHMIGFAGGLNLYAYVGNNPVNAVDPSGLEPEWRSPLSRWKYYNDLRRRVRAGMNYYGGLDVDGTTDRNCSGDTLQGVGMNPEGIANLDAGKALKNYKIFQVDPKKKVALPKMLVGDIVQLNGHWATVVDHQRGQPIFFGQDGNLGVISGTLDQFTAVGNPLEAIYRVPGSASSNTQVQEYRRLLQVKVSGKYGKYVQEAIPNGVHLPPPPLP